MNQIIKDDIAKMISDRNDLECFRNCTFLISGANSFMMSYLIYFLLESNRQNGLDIKIIALCRNKNKAEERFAEYLENQDLSLIIQDICQPIHYRGNIDYCIHAASPAGIVSRQEYPADTFLINLQGCKNLLDLCLQKKIKRFMLLSSVDVYGTGLESRRLKETDVGVLDWNYVRNAYSSGKRAAETLCSLHFRQYGIPCVIVRPFQVYGPGMSLADGRLHGDFIRQLLSNKKIVLKSDGRARRSFIYLSDATDAMLDVLLYGNNGEAYNICDEESECSVYELAMIYVSIIQDAEIEFIYGKRNTPEVKEALSIVVGDASKLRKLGWKQTTSLKAGVEKTLGFYMKMNRG